MKKMGLLAVILVIILALTSCSSGNYQKAKELFDSGSYSEAMTLFEELGDYEDSASMITECKYQSALSLYKEGKYEEAISALEPFADRADAVKAIQDCKYNLALKEYESCNDIESYQKVKELFTGFNGYKDSQNIVDDCDEKINETIYNNALALFEDKKYDEAVKAFAQVENYKDSKKYSTYISAVEAHQNEDYKSSVEGFESIVGFLDVEEYLDSYVWFKVKSVKKGDDLPTLFFDYIFDENHNVLSYKEKHYRIITYSYEYDERNNIVKESEEIGGPSYTRTRFYTYDSNNEKLTIKGITVVNDDVTITDNEYQNEYDSNGKLIKQSITNYKGEKRVYEFSDGKLMNYDEYYENSDSVAVHSTYEYDEHGWLIQEHHSSNRNGFESITKYEYDKYGNAIKESETELSKVHNGEFDYEIITEYEPMFSSKI